MAQRAGSTNELRAQVKLSRAEWVAGAAAFQISTIESKSKFHLCFDRISLDEKIPKQK